MTTDNEKENIGAISNEENQQNVDAFTAANVQNYILAQRAENTVKKQNTTWTSGRGFFVNKRNRAIEDIPVEEMNILTSRFMKDKKKRDGGAVRAHSSRLTRFLPSFSRKIKKGKCY